MAEPKKKSTLQLPKLKVKPRTPKIADASSLADHFLEDALIALRSAGNPDVLYERPRWSGMGLRERAVATYSRNMPPTAYALEKAAERRASFSRTAIIVTAFAAEAFANVYLAAHFDSVDVAALDKLKTVQKFETLPALVGQSRMKREEQPLGGVVDLMKLRNQLAHAKHGEMLPSKDLSVADPVYSPKNAARLLIATAEATSKLQLPKGLPSSSGHSVALLIALHSHVLTDYAKRISEDLPMPADDPPPNLLWEMFEAFERKKKNSAERRVGESAGTDAATDANGVAEQRTVQGDAPDAPPTG